MPEHVFLSETGLLFFLWKEMTASRFSSFPLRETAGYPAKGVINILFTHTKPGSIYV